MIARRTALLGMGAGVIGWSAAARAGIEPGLSQSGWSELTFKDKEPNSFTAAEGGVRVESNKTVSLIYQPVQANINATPVLTWRWRVDAAPPPTDLTKKGGDDRAIALYVAFVYEPERAGFIEKAKRAAASITSDRPLPGRVLIYTWGGNGSANGWFDNPYLSSFSKMKVLRGPEAPLQTWIDERVDLVADHQEAFGYPPSQPTELSVSCDSDDTKVRVVSYIADINFQPRA